ncbi:hypothetical protein [Nocardia arthritidis]|uniref:Uncharacterized protein n=1 Tax=Nocardia arthritidis TaxID=228602 RepID=A0A6G9Y648_9NOCA|nr:hypothetical protein F5544_03500 [Nocardia arthritidis]
MPATSEGEDRQMTLDEATTDLYALHPSEFVAARDALVRSAREAGDRELATAIGKLRKPTVTAWTVNLLAREAPREVDALLELAAALRAAQRELSGQRLRTLTAQRQQMVNALAKRAGALAAEHGRPASEAVLREVGQTLTAALADPAVAEQVHTGTLTSATTYEGFGPAGPTLSVLEHTPEDSKATAPEQDSDQDRDEARAALESARAARDTAATEADEAAHRLAEINSRIERLRDELDRAEHERQFARAADRSAKEHLHTVQKQVDRAERRVAKAEGKPKS